VWIVGSSIIKRAFIDVSHLLREKRTLRNPVGIGKA
jgi:hypothetical protein